MAEHFNKKSGISGSVPLGSFNSMFGFTRCWEGDAAATKALAMDGFYFPLYEVRLITDDLVLRDDVKRAVPCNWNPQMLSRLVGNKLDYFISRYCYVPDAYRNIYEVDIVFFYCNCSNS